MLVELPTVLVLNPKDNVGVVPANVDAGRALVNGVVAAERIPRGHKVAIKPIAEGTPVLKYGQIIGYATREIRPGEHVHLQNLAIHEVELKHEFCVDNAAPAMVPKAERRIRTPWSELHRPGMDVPGRSRAANPENPNRQ